MNMQIFKDFASFLIPFTTRIKGQDYSWSPE